jgi:hypothetical protein
VGSYHTGLGRDKLQYLANVDNCLKMLVESPGRT